MFSWFALHAWHHNVCVQLSSVSQRSHDIVWSSRTFSVCHFLNVLKLTLHRLDVLSAYLCVNHCSLHSYVLLLLPRGKGRWKDRVTTLDPPVGRFKKGVLKLTEPDIKKFH